MLIKLLSVVYCFILLYYVVDVLRCITCHGVYYFRNSLLTAGEKRNESNKEKVIGISLASYRNNVHAIIPSCCFKLLTPCNNTEDFDNIILYDIIDVKNPHPFIAIKLRNSLIKIYCYPKELRGINYC